MDIYRKFHPKGAENSFFSSVHEKFSRIDHVNHKISLNKLIKTETISNIFSGNNGIKLESNYKNKTAQTHSY